MNEVSLNLFPEGIPVIPVIKQAQCRAISTLLSYAWIVLSHFDLPSHDNCHYHKRQHHYEGEAGRHLESFPVVG